MFTLAFLFGLLLAPAQAFAQTISLTAAKTGWFLPGFFSGGPGCAGGKGCNIVNIVGAFIANARPLVGIGAVFVITIAGFRMVTTEEEESFSKSKRIISAALTGVVLSYLIVPFVNAFYGGLGAGNAGTIFGGIYGIGSVPQGNIILGASVLFPEVLGIIDWALVIIGTLAVLMIIISGIKAMTKAGSEEGIEEIRRTVLYVAAGLLLIIFRGAINLTLGLSTTQPVVPGATGIAPVAIAVVKIVNFILGFAALMAVIMIVYAGLLMVMNLGNEEQFTKAKGLIIRVGIGLMVIGVSFTLVNFVIAAALP